MARQAISIAMIAIKKRYCGRRTVHWRIHIRSSPPLAELRALACEAVGYWGHHSRKRLRTCRVLGIPRANIGSTPWICYHLDGTQGSESQRFQEPHRATGPTSRDGVWDFKLIIMPEAFLRSSIYLGNGDHGRSSPAHFIVLFCFWFETCSDLNATTPKLIKGYGVCH
jgi:hypothetical protein